MFLVDDLTTASPEGAVVAKVPGGPTHAVTSLISPDRDTEPESAGAVATRRRRWAASVATLAAVLVAAVGLGVAEANRGPTSPHTASAATSSAPMGRPSPAASTIPPSPTELITAAVARDASSEACSQLRRDLSGLGVLAAKHRTAAQGLRDKRRARAYVARHAWAGRSSHYLDDLNRLEDSHLRGLADAALHAAENRPTRLYYNAFEERCGLTRTVNDIRRSVQRTDAAVDQLQARARTAPWWPVGYQPISRDVAWMPLRPGQYTCPELSTCGRVKVVTRRGCDTLYVEVTQLDSAGQAVDFSNDMLVGLQPHEVGVMNFLTTDGSKTYRLSDVSCY